MIRIILGRRAVLVISRKTFLGVALVLGSAFFTTAVPAAGQAAAAQATWKDQAESDLYQSMTKEADPQKKLALFQQWKEKYPASGMGAYFQGLYVQAIQTIAGPIGALFGGQATSADQLAAAQKSADYLTANLDTLFAADRKPAQLADADWAKAKKDMGRMASNAPAYIAMQKNDYATAEAGFTKSLQDDPQQAQSGQLAYWLAGMLFKDKKYAPALFQYARASSYDGPGSLAEAGRNQVKASLEKTYVAYHGSKDGLDEVLALAKTAALPPADFKLLSKREIAEAKLAKENADREKLAGENPGLALWRSLKEALTGDQAQAYFNEHMKGTAIPQEFKGKLIETKPALNPKELVLALDGDAGDCTVKLETALRGKMEPGAEIGFKNGAASSYSASPFMVTFDVENANLTGWKGAPAPPAKPKVPVRRPAAPAAKK
jgi:tetratricopeptide (TPR) repeat protein